MSSSNFGNIGDRRQLRDPSKDGRLEWILNHPDEFEAEQAASRKKAEEAECARLEELRAGPPGRKEATEIFGDWAIVAEVLWELDGLRGEALAAAVEAEKKTAGCADEWMRREF